MGGALEVGPPHFTAWLALPYPPAVEAVARAGFHSVTLDAQHGYADFDTVVGAIAAAALAGRPAMVRLPLNGFGFGARALDVGAAGVIAPMIDSAADARAFVDAVKFPPLGRRSWGPIRAQGLLGLERDAYLAQANDLTLALAMIETERGLGHVDEIVGTDGIDGLLIGPNDLCVSLTGGAAVDPGHPSVVAALDRVLTAARRAGKPVAIYANTASFASDYLRRGFAMIALGTDLNFLAAGAERALADVFDAPATGAGHGG
ncbi:aldolase/citrate lyase family protein [Methylopila sp. M107]|uniref:HpcH/HpaI aldolase family protein n=1 Tax=Methylopila sp. M107 TaxID=1101190 RepID=UPI00037B2982|nr:aldolase/citrate lyase family protein [Methylopila sp. M107]